MAKKISLQQFVDECGSKAEAARQLDVGWQILHEWLIGKRHAGRAHRQLALEHGVILPERIK